MALTVCGLSAFGQGYFMFSGGPGSVWTGTALGGPTRGPAVYNVAFLWGTGTPLVDSFTTLVPTNFPGVFDWSVWTAILSDSNFQLATDSDTGTLVVAPVGNNGNFVYSVSPFPVTGTSSAGGVVQEYVIAWSNLYATPAAAATAGSVVGWSAPFTYNYTSTIGTPLSITASGFLPFGAAPIPEPSTLALAGLGSLSLLLFRRRK